MFATIANGTIARYPADPRADHPNTSFGDGWAGGEIGGIEYVGVQETPRPDYDPMTQNVVDSAALVDGVWTQQWAVVAASDEECAQQLAVWREGAVVSRFQARAALLGAGLLATVEAAIANPATSAFDRLAWSDSVQFHRNSPTLVRLAASLGMSDEQLDGLFRAAAEIVA